MTKPTAVIFDVGNVLYDWDPRLLYAPVFAGRGIDGSALDAFLRDVCTKEWHFQFDRGEPFADGAAELISRFPQHAEMIRLWGERFVDQVGGMLPGMRGIVDDLHAGGVPVYAISNFSGEFWPPFRAREAWLFDRFRDVVVSGDEGLVKPDPAIYRLALRRFGLRPEEALFVDDREENVAGAVAVGMHAVLFEGADALRGALVEAGLLR